MPFCTHHSLPAMATTTVGSFCASGSSIFFQLSGLREPCTTTSSLACLQFNLRQHYKNRRGYSYNNDCIAAKAQHDALTYRSDPESNSESDFPRPLEEGLSRRTALSLSLAAALATSAIPAGAAGAIATTSLAGRVPGLSEADDNGLRTYKRPDKKSGGHGVGWSELIPYTFQVPATDWDEVPVSIADLGGTEIDLRFASSQEGSLSVVVAPILRFSSALGDNAHIEDIGTPDKVINAFGPEITGENVEGKVKGTGVKDVDGRKYYQYELDPHILVSATAAGNRMYILTVSASSRQWKKYNAELRLIANSFRVG